MAKVSLSDTDRSIESIWSWYDDQKEALRDFRNKIIDAINTSSAIVNDKFVTLTIDELNNYFENSQEELEHLVCFNLISAAEGQLRKDFFIKVYHKDKSPLGRTFRNIYKQKGERIRLDDDIITTWQDTIATSKSKFSDFLGLLHYRHWLAHGRYWNLSTRGRQYSAGETYDITELIFDAVTEK